MRTNRRFNAIVSRFDFCRFELSIQVDCTFDAIFFFFFFFGKNVTFVASKLAARGQFIFCLLFNVYDI